MAAPQVPQATAPLRVHLAADAVNVGRLRRELRRRLVMLVDDADLVDDLCLAASEAVENAIDHAFVDRAAGTVVFRADHDVAQRAVVVAVIDDGQWHRPEDPGYRGRGLALIESLTDSHRLDTGPQGTSVTMRKSVDTG